LATPTRIASKRRPLRRGSLTGEKEFLPFVGARVRELRNQRGMTRKMVAHEADVSERHLAQLESGEGQKFLFTCERAALWKSFPRITSKKLRPVFCASSARTRHCVDREWR